MEVKADATDALIISRICLGVIVTTLEDKELLDAAGM